MLIAILSTIADLHALAGQEISLRLRTDDLKGIRETLIHELAHMVWGDHDDNFKELNSQVSVYLLRLPFGWHIRSLVDSACTTHLFILSSPRLLSTIHVSSSLGV
jgi:hypothetical protein